MLSSKKILLGFTVIYSIYKCTTSSSRSRRRPKKVIKTDKTDKIDKTDNIDKTDKTDKIDNIDNIDKKRMIIRNSDDFYDDILQYIYEKYSSQVNSFNYSLEEIPHFNEFRYRRTQKTDKFRIYQPENCSMDILYNGHNIHIELNDEMDKNNNHMKLLILPANYCGGHPTEELCRKITLSSQSSELLTEFADDAREWVKKKTKAISIASKETMNVYYYKKDFWQLLSKSPKRPLSTVYLKEGLKEELLDSVNNFFSFETRDIYLSFGVPYKCVNLIHGPPGTGKTSLIKALASDLDCDLYILPISKDMLDTNLVDAFSFISENESKERIIVIEDIDTVFDSGRKADDDKNGITLQAFLNCLDGFTCVEGTMLFLTANRPEVLDFAMIRSCRIDNKIKLDNADEPQTRKMFNTFLPNQSDNYNDFYEEIRFRKYSTAMLQEFLFYNRDCENILDIIDKFVKIIENNDPKGFEILKESNKNFYS